MNKKNLLRVLGLVISLVFIYLVFRGVNLPAVFENIKKINVLSVIAVALLGIFLVVFKTWRWKMILNKSVSLPFWTLLSINFVTNFLNIIFPFRAGEVAQIYLTKSHTRITKSDITGGLFLNKFMELFSLLILFYSLTIFVKIPLPDFWLRPIKYLLIFTLAFLFIFAFNVINIKKIKKPSNKILANLHNFFQSLKHIEDKPLLIKSLFMSLFIWGIELAMIYILLNSFKLNVPFWSSIVILVAINLAMLIPATSGSFGPYEYAIVIVLTMFAVTKEQALAFAVMLHFLEIIVVLGIGFVFYLRIKEKIKW